MGGTAALRHRALLLSDLPLATRACRAEDILAFPRDYDADTSYLVGDVVDFWRLQHGAYWPQQHHDVVQKLLRKVRKGSRIVVIPGDHDEALRAYCGAQFGGIGLVRDAIHMTADGRRIPVIHSDDFDGVVHCTKWMSLLGGRAYVLTLWTNTVVNRARRLLGLGYWSLSAPIKLHAKRALASSSKLKPHGLPRHAAAALTASFAVTSTMPPTSKSMAWRI